MTTVQGPPHWSHPPPPPPTARRAAIGAGTIVALVAFTLFGRFAGVMNAKTAEDDKRAAATLPAVGAEGTLARATPMCPVPSHAGFFGWPCGKSERRTIAAGSHVRVMKTTVRSGDALCRYWVKSGPDDGASGDGLCDGFHAEPGSR